LYSLANSVTHQQKDTLQVVGLFSTAFPTQEEDNYNKEATAIDSSSIELIDTIDSISSNSLSSSKDCLDKRIYLLLPLILTCY
jgi:hypothetical protein